MQETVSPASASTRDEIRFELAQKTPKKHSPRRRNPTASPSPCVLGRGAKRWRRKFPDVKWDKYHIDILSALFVLSRTASTSWGVETCSATSSPIRAGLHGTIGMRRRNINPERTSSVFEPVHGSAPDIAGRGSPNPIGPDLVRRHERSISARAKPRRRSSRRSSGCWSIEAAHARLGGLPTHRVRQGVAACRVKLHEFSSARPRESGDQSQGWIRALRE